MHRKAAISRELGPPPPHKGVVACFQRIYTGATPLATLLHQILKQHINTVNCLTCLHLPYSSPQQAMTMAESGCGMWTQVAIKR